MKSSKILITSLLAAAAMSAVPAWATDYTVTGTFTGGKDNNNLTGTIDGTRQTITLSSGDTLTFSGATSGYFPKWGGGDRTVAANIVISNRGSITINDGDSGSYMIFSGSVSGAGDFIVNGSKDPAKGQDFIFTGNLTAFTGGFSRPVANFNASGTDFYNNSNTGILQFGGTVSPNGIGSGTAYVASATAGADGIVHNISGQGSITTTSVLRYNYTGSANEGVTALGIDNSSISARYLDFRGGANYTVSSTVTGNNGTVSNNTLKVSAGTTTFTGAVSKFGTINVASGAKAIFQGAFRNVVGTAKNNLTIAAGSDVSFQSTAEGGVLTANADSTVKFSSTASFTQLSGSGTIDLGSTGTLTLSPPSGSSKFNNWTGTIKVGANTGVNGTQSANWNCAEATVEFSGAQGWLEGFSGGTFAANIKLVDTASGAAGFQWKDGSSTNQTNPIVTLSGKLTGTGTFERANASFNQSFVFSGNLSEFAGTFKHTDSYNYATLTFGGKTNAIEDISAADGSVTGTSTINWFQGTLNSGQDKRVYFNYSNDVRSDSTITGAILVKQGAGSLTLTGTNTYTGGTTVEAGTLVAGSARAFGSGALTVNAGAKVSANGYAVDLGAGNVTINGAYVITAVDSSTTTGTLGTSGTITFGDTGKLDVSGLAAGTYTVFGGTGTVSGLTQDKLYKESGRDTVTFADDTYKTFTLTKGAGVYDLTWTSAAGTWAADTTWQNNTQGGEENPTFADGDTVTFAASETAAKEISVVGAKDALAVNVTGGDYAFSAGEGGSLSVRGALTVSSGASLTLSDGVLGTVAGGIVLDGGTAMLKLVDAGLPGLTNIVSGSGKVVLERVSTQIAEPTISTTNVLTGAISVEKIGNTKVSITAAQSYTGGTTITAGIIGVGHNSALGSGTITLNGGQITAHIAALTLANAIEIGANGGTIHTNDNASNTITLNGTISGTGTLTKAGAGTLALVNPTASSVSGTGGIVVEEGTLYLSGSGNHFGVSKDITLKDGTFLKWNDASQSSDASYQYELSGALAVEGNTTITGATNYAKEVALLGNLSGSGTLTYYRGNGDSGSGNFNSNGRLIVAGADNSGFTGTIVIGGQTTAVSQGLDLNADLANGTISLQGGSGDAAYMRVLKSATIKGLNGNANSSVGIGNVLQDGKVGAYTLTVGEGNFAGTIEDNGEARKYGSITSTKVTGAVLSIVKNTAGTLTLSGNNTFTGGIEIAKGVVEATNAAALGAAANAVRVSGGQLKVSNVTLNQTNISVVLNDGAYLAGAAIFGTGSGALADGTTISVSGDVAALKAVCTSATGRYDFTLYDNNTLTTGVTNVTVDGDFATALAGAGWTYSLSEDKSILTISVPEPSAFGLLAGAGALALVAARRRRRKKA